uniref:(California timema) hypothetical protein n=1 Tax=Timema californicum TaxID=61474 RepID=A0A7R9JDM6_TIMCA|nr:unnamed protein product [Timema californicum]
MDPLQWPHGLRCHSRDKTGLPMTGRPGFESRSMLPRDLNSWNCNNSCLQALALSPRSELSDSRGGRSPMISPRSSPQLHRRGATPVVPPPPLPPRRASPTLGSPTNSPSSHLSVPNEEAPPPPCTCVVTVITQDTDQSDTSPAMLDTRYDVLATSSTSSATPRTSSNCHVRHQSCPSLPSSSAVALPSKSHTTPLFPPPLPPQVVAPVPPSSQGPPLQRQHSGGNTIHYAELADITEEPSYENTVIVHGNPQTMKSLHSTSETDMMSSVAYSKIVSLGGSENRLTGSSSGGPSNGRPWGKEASEAQKQHYQRGETSVAYENLNMDYIMQLTSEGYAQDAVIRALGITRNDIEMAWDILHEFATKQTSA